MRRLLQGSFPLHPLLPVGLPLPFSSSEACLDNDVHVHLCVIQKDTYGNENHRAMFLLNPSALHQSEGFIQRKTILWTHAVTCSRGPDRPNQGSQLKIFNSETTKENPTTINNQILLGRQLKIINSKITIYSQIESNFIRE
jgi:hypothetical protein